MKKILFSILLLFISSITIAQEYDNYTPKGSFFWRDVKFGGGLGLGFGSGYTNIAISPSAIKPITEEFYLGASLQFNYLKSKDFFESTSYGGSILALYNPAPIIQLSVELEQLRVHNKIDDFYTYNKHKDNFWNTALFLGVGYTSGNATIGVRYNVLYQKDNFVYNQAWLPFIRVYF